MCIRDRSTVVKIDTDKFLYMRTVVEDLRVVVRDVLVFLQILNRFDEDYDYLKRVCFSDEATFHTSGSQKGTIRILGFGTLKKCSTKRKRDRQS